MANISQQTDNTDGQYGASQPSSNLELNIAMGMVAMLSVCGILGNSLVIFVFSRQKQKLSSTIFILTLAVTDFITSLVTMPYTVVIELLEYEIEYEVLCKTYQFLKTTTIPFSAFVMVAIALDRYLCIVYPFNHYMTIQRAKITVFGLSMLALALGVFVVLSNGMVETCVGSNAADEMPYSVSYKMNSSMTNIDAIYPLADNLTDLKSAASDQSNITRMECHKVCDLSTSVFDLSFIMGFLRLYSAFFGFCAVFVVFLYALTYRSVLMQRRKRLHLRNMCCGFLTRNASEKGEKRQDNTEFTVLSNVTESPSANGSKQNPTESQKDGPSSRERAQSKDTNDGDNNVDNTNHTDDQQLRSGCARAKLKKLRVANVKTALMLSIVAFIYIVAFTPAWMMALEILHMNVIVYYLYFTYNVANPVIYAFLNQNFRTQLKSIFKCRCGH